MDTPLYPPSSPRYPRYPQIEVRIRNQNIRRTWKVCHVRCDAFSVLENALVAAILAHGSLACKEEPCHMVMIGVPKSGDEQT